MNGKSRKKLTRRKRVTTNSEVDKFKDYLADPRSKTDPPSAYADHYGHVIFVAKEEQGLRDE